MQFSVIGSDCGTMERFRLPRAYRVFANLHRLKTWVLFYEVWWK
jgi:hypothetical protein